VFGRASAVIVRRRPFVNVSLDLARSARIRSARNARRRSGRANRSSKAPIFRSATARCDTLP